MALVLIHSTVALEAGCQLTYWTGLSTENQQALALETGIQNSGLGLILVFTFFDGPGGITVGITVTALVVLTMLLRVLLIRHPTPPHRLG